MSFCSSFVYYADVKSDNGKAADLKPLATREPFRPFGVRLTNGARYDFKEPRDFGATKNFHAIVYFDNDGGLDLRGRDRCRPA